MRRRATGDNGALVARICGALPCRVGGGIRSIERAAAALALGANKVILGSALFRDGKVDVDSRQRLAERLGPDG